MDEYYKFLSAIPRVLLESTLSRAERNLEADRLISAPPPGTPLLVSLAFAVEHTGIYLGKNQVAELHGDGDVRIVSLTEFINGDTEDSWPLRNGTRIFAACDAATRRPLCSKKAAKTAVASASTGVASEYDFMQTNCHLFTAACLRGIVVDSLKFRVLLGGGITSIGKLERCISKRLNNGNPIKWCGVARSKENFRYRLTDEKRARLRAEGKLK